MVAGSDWFCCELGAREMLLWQPGQWSSRDVELYTIIVGVPARKNGNLL